MFLIPVGSLGRSSNILSCFSSFPVPPSFVCRHPVCLFLEGVLATSREKGRHYTQQHTKSVQADLGLMSDYVLSPNHLSARHFSPLKGEAIFSPFHFFTFSPLKGEAIFSPFRFFTFKGRSHLFTFSPLNAFSLFHLYCNCTEQRCRIPP